MMMTTTEERGAAPPPSLSALFARGQASYEGSLRDGSPSHGHEYETQLNEAIAGMTTAQALVTAGSLFSANETLEDVHSADLKYFLVDAYLGQLVLLLRTGDRQRILLVAKNHLETFQRNLERLGIAPRTGGSADANSSTARERKIQVYRRQKQLDTMVTELRARRATLVAHEHVEEGGDLDEVERGLALAQLEQHALAAQDSLSMIERELEMLQHAARMHLRVGQEDRRMAPTAANAEAAEAERASARVDVVSPGGGGRGRTPFLSPDGKVTGTFVLVSKREQLRKGVFGYGHNLPTMSIDEYLEMEMEQGNILSGGGKQPEPVVLDDNDMEAIDAATYKARQMDAFKDDNPRGWGNRYNRS